MKRIVLAVSVCLLTFRCFTLVASEPLQPSSAPSADPSKAKLDVRPVSLSLAKLTPLKEHPTLQKMLAENNQIRVANRLRPHRISGRLSAAAQNHANYMAQTGSFSHYTNGDPAGRAAIYGHRGGVRENIAMGQRDPRTAFATWNASSGHFTNLCSNSDLAGFGYAVGQQGQKYWVALYGMSDGEE